jgi:hypothetical protein
MGRAGVVWKIVRTAASSIPWVSVVENTPALLDLVERARERFRAGASHDMEEQLNALQEENLKLADTLLRTTNHLQEVTNTLEVVLARQKTLGVVTVISLLAAVSALALALLK